MNQREAIEVLESIRDIYPKSDQTKRKANMLLPKLTQMDFPLVMEKLSAHVASHPYAPTIAEIAAYPAVQNDHLHAISMWRREAAKVPQEIKQAFHRQMVTLLKEKTNDNNS